LKSFRIDLERDEGREAVVVRLHGEIDASNAGDIVASLADLGSSDVAFLDLTDVDYFDSAGMAAIETLRTSIRLHIIAAQDSLVRRALEISGFDQLVPIVERLQDVPADASTHFG
jgi:anti-anti-sigma factor